MPANKKYLSKSPWQRFAKISAGFLGGYLVTMSFHLALTAWADSTTVIITAAFSAFIMWAVLFVVSFLAKNGWKIWGIYIALTIVFSTLMYLGDLYNPIV
ncbi:hypothetical protein FNB79_00715 [Formosa sediminum]|uniref:DUF3649 domain-containing protein n=1 Tax=Formosa sediminum TaxID=2594004 RepID=A0A516GM17_9FLAO|nr:hypothetical protein [Formosa sediminum]QDO92563.1 hypothetical protein FNB79_00715 [Formosa sediminum]